MKRKKLVVHALATLVLGLALVVAGHAHPAQAGPVEIAAAVATTLDGCSGCGICYYGEECPAEALQHSLCGAGCGAGCVSNPLGCMIPAIWGCEPETDVSWQCADYKEPDDPV